MNHFYRSIPGWFSFRELYERMVREAHDGAHFAEIGCWKGRSAAFMAVEIINSGKQIRFDCIDTWKGSKEQKHLTDPAVQNGTLFDEFWKNIAPVRKHIWVIPALSVVAARTMYRDESLDFVMIDASHDYANVIADICAWLPKVKPGGVIAGDDANKREVARAVKDCFPDGFETLQGSGKGKQWLVSKP